MNRFAPSFNGIDPVTGRPFSWGMPDGVWIIATVYSLLVLATLIRAALAVFMAGAKISADLVVPIMIASALFIPALILLFARSKLAATWMAGLAALFLIVAVLMGVSMSQQGALTSPAAVALLVVVFAQGYIAYYAFALKRDLILL